MFRRAGRVRAIRPAGADAALQLALRDPLINALAGARLQEVAHTTALGQEFVASGEESAPQGLLWNGVNTSPLSANQQALTEFGRYLAGRTRRCSSMVGERRAIEALWERVAQWWGPSVREYRWSQPLLAAMPDAELPVLPPAGLRAARDAEAELVFPAAVAMFREEVGVDPLRGDGGRGYRRRVGELIRQRRTYVVIEDGQVLFKADVGALFGPVAQIHGVWTRPEARGRGIGRRAMAELTRAVRRDHAAQVSLYVNDFNEPARRAYAAAGYRQVGELATILF